MSDPVPVHKPGNVESGLKTLATALGVVGAAISAMIGYTTIRSSQDQLAIATQQRCIDFTRSYVEAVRSAVSQDISAQAETIRDSNYKYLAFNHDLRQAICHKAGFDEDFGLPPKDELRKIADPLTADQTSASSQPPITGVMSGDQPTAPAPARLAGPPAAPPLRLFIQIHDPDQRPAATRLQLRLQARMVQGHPIIVPGIEQVGTATQNSLRCLKAADCALNPALAAVIIQQLQPPAQLARLDLSARYEASPNIRPGSYELWFGPGPITLAEE